MRAPHGRMGVRRSGGLSVVAFGGGTGLPVLLRGLRDVVDDVTAVVTVADDGGSSGRLRDELGVMPPGDVRNCLVALSRHPDLAQVFDYRFCRGGEGLYAHSVGNLILAGLADLSGGFCAAVDRAAKLLDVKGRVLPAATESLTLMLRYEDGTLIRGESNVGRGHGVILRTDVEPHGAGAPVDVIAAIDRAHIVALAPGSLFTSTIPALLGGGVAEALARFEGPVVYAANVMTQPGETTGMTLSDHLTAISDHVGSVVTDVVVHSEEIGPEALAPYLAQGAAEVEIDAATVEALGVHVRYGPLLADDDAGIRHDPERLAGAVLGVVRERAGAEAPR